MTGFSYDNASSLLCSSELSDTSFSIFLFFLLFPFLLYRRYQSFEQHSLDPSAHIRLDLRWYVLFFVRSSLFANKNLTIKTHTEVEVPSNIDNNYWELLVEVNATEGNPDIFVRHDKFPTPHDLDGQDTSSDAQSSVSIVNAKPGKWFVGIRPYGEVAYQWKVTIVPMRK